MATKDFEIQQLLKAYRKGLISDALFEAQMKELGAATDGLDVANVLALRGDASKVSAQMLQKTPQSQTMTFTIPPTLATTTRTPTKGTRSSTSSMAVRSRGSQARNKRSGRAICS